MQILRLKKRVQFLQAAKSIRARRNSVVIQARMRNKIQQNMPKQITQNHIGAGFTTTKKIGNAVIRNRAKRRLRAATDLLLPTHGIQGTDYVFIATYETAYIQWPRLVQDIETALSSLSKRLKAATYS